VQSAEVYIYIYIYYFFSSSFRSSCLLKRTLWYILSVWGICVGWEGFTQELPGAAIKCELISCLRECSQRWAVNNLSLCVVLLSNACVSWRIGDYITEQIQDLSKQARLYTRLHRRGVVGWELKPLTASHTADSVSRRVVHDTWGGFVPFFFLNSQIKHQLGSYWEAGRKAEASSGDGRQGRRLMVLGTF